jgi:hypothetical protein
LTVVLVSPVGAEVILILYDSGMKREIAWRGPETTAVHRSTYHGEQGPRTAVPRESHL